MDAHKISVDAYAKLRRESITAAKNSNADLVNHEPGIA